MFMTNLKVAGSKLTKLKLFYILWGFCIFGIKKVEISKKIFSKGYFIIRLCTFMANFRVASQKMTKLRSFFFCVFFAF